MIRIPKLTIINYYYLAVVLIYFIAIYIPFIRIGLFMSFIMILGIYLLHKNKQLKYNNKLDLLVGLYIIYNISTIVFFMFAGLPIIVFIKEFSNSILPIILFYFFGRVYESVFFYKITLYSLVACFIVGFFLQSTLPQNYLLFMSKIDGVSANPLNFVVNYRSFLGLTATGSLSAITVLLSFNILYKSKFKKGKIMLVICLIALVLTFRRAALYTGIFAFLWVNYSVLFKLKGSKLIFFLTQFFFLLLGYFVILSYNPELLNDLILRLYSFSDAIDERSGSWIDGLSITQSVLTGDGLGRYGHKAVEYSDIYIPDGNYFRMLAEIGVIGFLLFFAIIFKSLYNGFDNFKNNYIELGIIIIVCMQAVGSDIFGFQLVAPVFWYSIGRCSRVNYHTEKIV